jgi:hypothetical protein
MLQKSKMVEEEDALVALYQQEKQKNKCSSFVLSGLHAYVSFDEEKRKRLKRFVKVALQVSRETCCACSLNCV